MHSPAHKHKLITKEVPESKHIPYLYHISDSIVKTDNGDYVVTFKLEGISVQTLSDNELSFAAAARKNLYNQFEGKPVMFYTHIIRNKTEINSQASFDCPFLSKFHKKYTSEYQKKPFYTNEIYITLVRKADKDFLKKSESILSLLLGREKDRSISKEIDDEIINEINDYIITIIGGLSKYRIRTLKQYEQRDLKWSEPMQFYGRLINNQKDEFKIPDGPISDYLPKNRKFFGWKRVAIEKNGKTVYGALLSIKGYCQKTIPGMFDNLTSLRCEMVITQSWEPINKAKSLEKIKTTSRRMKQGDDAVTLQRSLEREGGVTDMISSGELSLGTNHFSIFIYSEDDELIEKNIGEAISDLSQLGITAVVDNLNLEPAFWAQLPGNKAYIARKGDITSYNFSDMASYHNMPFGDSNCKWGEHITVLKTLYETPYLFNFHVDDIGIVNINGKSGSGKTVAMSGLIAQAMKHNPRLIAFDHDFGMKIFIKAMGGDYSPIKIGEPTHWNPLQLPDNLQNREFIRELLKEILKGDKDFVASEEREINKLVEWVFAEDLEKRVLRNFESFVASELTSRIDEFKRWITDQYGEVGENAWIFDNSTNLSILENQRIKAFDMTQFINKDSIRTPILMYMFHIIWESLDGTNTIIAVDEAWKALQDPIFSKMIERWSRTIRKKNAVLIFATQNVDDAIENNALITQCNTHLFFPNPKASANQTKRSYENWGLTEREIHLLTIINKPGHFLVKRPEGSVVVKMDLSNCQDEMAVFSGNEKTILFVDKLIKKFGDSPDKWLPIFIKRWRDVV
ncbi:hypothetical protein [Marinicella sp. W31]|uniref:VirB4 family type IV secretion/conjugal transfer ATPase n=1 Tax=Marinicella sp. W31 TaxID=3023713 RepID=UPI003758436D